MSPMPRALLSILILAALSSRVAAAELVLPPGQPLERAALEGLLRDAMADHGVAEPMALAIEQPPLPLANQAGSPITLTLVTLTHEPVTGHYRAQIEARLDGGVSRTISVAGTVQELVEVPVPQRPIGVGETIEATALKMIAVPASALRDNPIQSMAAAVGLEAQRALPAGRLIRSRDLAPPVMVRRGDAVRLVFARGGLEVTTGGQALEAGREGQSIRIANEASGEVRRGTVAGPHRVLVAGGNP